MTLYMLVTADKYELPLAVRDNVGEIADLLGRSKYDVYTTISKKQVSKYPYNGFKYRIIKIEVDDDDEEDCDPGGDG